MRDYDLTGNIRLPILPALSFILTMIRRKEETHAGESVAPAAESEIRRRRRGKQQSDENGDPASPRHPERRLCGKILPRPSDRKNRSRPPGLRLPARPPRSPRPRHAGRPDRPRRPDLRRVRKDRHETGDRHQRRFQGDRTAGAGAGGATERDRRDLRDALSGTQLRGDHQHRDLPERDHRSDGEAARTSRLRLPERHLHHPDAPLHAGAWNPLQQGGQLRQRGQHRHHRRPGIPGGGRTDEGDHPLHRGDTRRQAVHRDRPAPIFSTTESSSRPGSSAATPSRIFTPTGGSTQPSRLFAAAGSPSSPTPAVRAPRSPTTPISAA
jgi:hypothetical protein